MPNHSVRWCIAPAIAPRFEAALQSARAADRTAVIYAEVDPNQGVPGYESWWDVPVAEVSEQPEVRAARLRWQDGKAKQRR